MAKTNTTNTDQIRQLANRVHFAGILAELSEMREGNTSNGIPYISFSGVLQCGEDAVYNVPFRTFVKSKKSDGSDSKNFAKVKNWYNNAVPMTANKDNATKVDMVGSLTDNPYVNVQGKLVEGTQYNVQLFNDFKEYAAEIDLEGFVHSIVDETRGEENTPTGRKRMRLITRDMFGNTIDIKNIVIQQDLVDALDDVGYGKGTTAKFFITLTPNSRPKPVKKSGGIGVQRETQGASYLEWIMTGAEEPIPDDSENYLDPKLIKKAMDVRKQHLEEVEEAGYQGSQSTSTTTSTNRNSVGGKTTNASTKANDGFVEIEADEDFPF